MLKDDFRKLLGERIATGDNDAYEVDKYWKLEADMLSVNISETINFLDNDCTADEFSWISEIFEDIAERTQSKEYIDCLYRVAKKFPEECAKYNIYGSIQIAEDFMD